MQTFPAAQGTKLIVFDFEDNTYSLVPILGWTHVQGNTAYPILPIRNGGVTFGKAYLFADGTVYDAIAEEYHDNLESWTDYIESAEPSETRLVTQKIDKSLEEDPLAHAKEKPKSRVASGPLDHVRDPNPAYDDVEFGTKSYKGNSFWVIENEAVFVVPGEEVYPKTGAEKVKRTEYMARKRGDAGLPEVDYWEVRTDVAATVEEDDVDEESHDDVL